MDLNNYMQALNESAVIINNLQAQGYRLGKIKDLEFNADLNERELEAASKFKKSTLINSLVMVCILVVVTVAVIIAACVTEADFDPPVMRYIVPIFVGVISLGTIAVVLIRAFGPKKAAHVVVVAKTSRRARSRNGAQLYFVIAYQSSPEKIIVNNIPVTRKVFNEISNGDKAIIIKSTFGSSAVKVD